MSSSSTRVAELKRFHEEVVKHEAAARQARQRRAAMAHLLNVKDDYSLRQLGGLLGLSHMAVQKMITTAKEEAIADAPTSGLWAD